MEFGVFCYTLSDYVKMGSISFLFFKRLSSWISQQKINERKKKEN